MGIPYAMSYSATRQGIVLREVTCEFCTAEFVYALSREATGEGTSLLFLNNQGAEQEATRAAEAELAKKLENDIDPVPCPKCGLYQSAMVDIVRSSQHGWLLLIAILCPLVSFIAFCFLASAFIFNPVWATTGARIGLAIGGVGGILAAIGLLVLWNSITNAYDPNSHDHEAKRQSSKQKGMLKDDFDRDGPNQLIAPILETRKK